MHCKNCKSLRLHAERSDSLGLCGSCRSAHDAGYRAGLREAEQDSQWGCIGGFGLGVLIAVVAQWMTAG